MVDRILIIVSGIRTHAFDALSDALPAAGTVLVAMHYGYVSAWTTLNDQQQYLSLMLREITARYPEALVDFVAYGMGGLIVAKALHDPALKDRVRMVVLCGPPARGHQLRRLIELAHLSSKFRIILEAPQPRRTVQNFLRGIATVFVLCPPRKQFSLGQVASLAGSLRSDWNVIGGSILSAMRSAEPRPERLNVITSRIAPQLDRLVAVAPFGKAADQLRLIAEGLRVVLGISPTKLPEYAVLV